MNNIEITIERLEEIDQEREKTLSDEVFWKWCQEMKVGSRVEKRKLSLDINHFDTSNIDFQFKF